MELLNLHLFAILEVGGVESLVARFCLLFDNGMFCSVAHYYSEIQSFYEVSAIILASQEIMFAW